MSYLTVRETPDLQMDYLVMAFAGWPDAAEAATTTIKYLVRQLDGKMLAQIDPEEFYDFTQTRPHTSRTRDGHRRVHWPANDFYYWAKPESRQGILLFRGVEPNLKWRTFSQTITQLAQQYQVKTIIHVGALLDAIPHTREIRLTGSSNNPELQQTLDRARIKSSNYQGPTGITSALSEACSRQDIGFTSMWGHTPHYLQAAPNYQVTYTLAQNLVRLLNLPVDLNELKSAAATFDEEVARAIGKDEQLRSYVTKLEDRHDESIASIEMPEPADMVRELEQFLKSQQQRHQSEGD